MVELYNEEKEDIPLPGQEPIESGESNLPLGISETEKPTFFGNSIFTGGYLRSKNFITNVSGWELTSIGGEFNFAVSVDSLDIPDTVTANSFHVDVDGNTWWGATTLGASVASVTKAGLGTFSNIAITGGTVGASVVVNIGAVNIAARGWTQTSAFSVTDADTVAWAAGTFTSADGTAYSIGGGNTGNMAAATYIYLDVAVST